jgi:hypothetical protein
LVQELVLEIIQQAQKMGFKLITTDHGTINVKNPSKVVGDKTSLNLRYKTGRSLTYEYKDVCCQRTQKKVCQRST